MTYRIPDWMHLCITKDFSAYFSGPSAAVWLRLAFRSFLYLRFRPCDIEVETFNEEPSNLTDCFFGDKR
jgi:hypothetical protein